MLDCCKKNKWFYFGLTIPSMLLYVLALAGPLLLGTLPASLYNWSLIKGNKDFVGLGNYTKLLGDETFIDRKSTRLNSSHVSTSRMPSSA